MLWYVPRRTRRRHGFTLIELLVVVGIVAVLAAMLFPMYAAAKAAGHTAKCLSNEKQLYGALMLYVQDYSGRLPNATFLSYSKTAKGNKGLYIPYVKNIDILRCQKSGSYGCNIATSAPINPKAWAYLGNLTSVQIHVIITDTDAKGNPVRRGRPLNDVKYPGRMMCFICSQPAAKNLAPDPGLVIGQEANGWEFEAHDLTESKARLENRHNGGTTFAFLDGHCACLRPTGIAVGLPIATAGMDLDGDGTVGSTDCAR